MHSKHAVSKKTSKISVRLCFIVTIILVFVFALNFTRITLDTINNLDQQYRDKALSVITAANIAVENRHNFGSGDYLQKLCERLIEVDPSLINISVSTVKQNVGMVVIASNNGKEIGKRNNSDYYASLKKGVTVFEEDNELFRNDRKLEVF